MQASPKLNQAKLFKGDYGDNNSSKSGSRLLAAANGLWINPAYLKDT